jgi:uncharacterized protein YoaH (UPF0181 family)
MTRKRIIKKLMGKGISRNEAAYVAYIIRLVAADYQIAARGMHYLEKVMGDDKKAND